MRDNGVLAIAGTYGVKVCRYFVYEGCSPGLLCVSGVGGVTLETVRAYDDAQGTDEHARKSTAKTKTKSLR